MINNVTLVGRMTYEPEVRSIGDNNSVVNITLAVERTFTNAQGEKETDFIRCVAWRKTAEIIGKFAVKGSLVAVTGSIQTGKYTNNDGVEVNTTDINIDKFQMLEPKSVTDERRAKAQGGGQQNRQQGNQQNRQTNNKPASDPVTTFKAVSDRENPFVSTTNNSFDPIEDNDEDDYPF